MTDFPKELTDLMDKATREFASGLGLLCEKVNVDSIPQYTNSIGMIGFGGNCLLGMLAVQCSPELLKSSHPSVAMGIPVADPELQDWLGEIANQILGRFKNLLLVYEAKLVMSTPTVIQGQSLTIAMKKGISTYTASFYIDGEPVCIQLSGSVIQPIDFTNRIESDGASEGDSLLF